MSIFSEMLTTGLGVIREEQLQSGEIATYRRAIGRSLEYCFTVPFTAYVHDALACFDPSSRWFEVQTLETLSSHTRSGFVRLVTDIRRDIRAFLAWQEHADGTWLFYGRGSTLAPDLNTTACAAAALLDATGPADSRREADRLEPFRSTSGRYASLRSRDLEPTDSEGFAANANALRYLALAGGQFEPLMDRLLVDLREGNADWRSRGRHEMIACVHALARACRQACLPDWWRLTGPGLSWLAQACEPAEGDDSLRAALAALGLHDLDADGDAIRLHLRALADVFEPRRGWPFAPFDGEGYGSPGLTTALAIAALARQVNIQDWWTA